MSKLRHCGHSQSEILRQLRRQDLPGPVPAGQSAYLYGAASLYGAARRGPHESIHRVLRDGGFRAGTGGAEKQKRREWIISFVFTLIPLIGFLIYGAVSSSMEIGNAFIYGLLLAVIFGIIMLYVFLRRALAKPFEGTVSDMRRKVHAGRRGHSRSQYLVYVNCEDGKRRKKEVNLTVFGFLKIGDRVRYLPKFSQPFEKFKTAADTETLCMFCGRKQSLANDSCEFCHNPLIK